MHGCNQPLRVVNLPHTVVDSEVMAASLEELCHDLAAVVRRDDYRHVTIGLVGFANPREKERTAQRLQRWLVAAGVPSRMIEVDPGDASGEGWTHALPIFTALAAEDYHEPRVLIALASDEEPALVH